MCRKLYLHYTFGTQGSKEMALAMCENKRPAIADLKARVT